MYVSTYQNDRMHIDVAKIFIKKVSVSPDDVYNYRVALDRLIPIVSNLIDREGGVCSIQYLTNNEQIIKILMKDVPDGFERGLTNILGHYSDYFNIFKDGTMVATYMGYEKGRVHQLNMDCEKDHINILNNATEKRERRPSTTSTHIHDDCDKESHDVSSTRCSICSESHLSLTNSSFDSIHHDQPTSIHHEFQSATLALWDACFDIQDEKRFIAALTQIHCFRQELWEKDVTRVEPPPAHALLNYAAGGPLHRGQLNYTGDERKERIRSLLVKILERLEREPERQIRLNILAEDPEIVAMKKGVVAKLQNFLEKREELVVLEKREENKPPFVLLTCKRDAQNRWWIPEEYLS